MYYTLVISGMQFLIVSDLGWCNIYQVFDSVVEELDKGSDTDIKKTLKRLAA